MKKLLLSLLGITLAVAASAQSPTPYPATPNVVLTQNVGETTELDWVYATQNTDGTAIAAGTTITANVYVAQPGGNFTLLKSGVTGTSFTTSAYTAPGVPCYAIGQVSTTAGGSAESNLTNSVCAKVVVPPPPVPGNPTAVTLKKGTGGSGS